MSRKKKEYTLTSDFVESPPDKWDQYVVNEDGTVDVLTGWVGWTWRILKLIAEADKFLAEKHARERMEHEQAGGVGTDQV